MRLLIETGAIVFLTLAVALSGVMVGVHLRGPTVQVMAQAPAASRPVQALPLACPKAPIDRAW